MKTRKAYIDSSCKSIKLRGPVPPEPSTDDPLFIVNFITEGLIDTYPIDTTIRIVRNHFGFVGDYEDCRFKTEGKQGLENINVLLEKDWSAYDSMKRDVIHALNVCGWSLSYEYTNGGVTKLSFEAKYINNCLEGFPNKQYVYHISPEVHKEKILKIGLAPKSRNEFFKYPPRIHFLYSKNDVYNLMFQLETTSRRAGRRANKKYSLYQIDLTKLPTDIKL